MRQEQGERILIAEPDTGYRASLMARLMARGHAVAAVSSPAEAAAVVDSFQPSVVVADSRLRQGKGSLIDWLRLRDSTADVPILLLGDPEHPEEVVAALNHRGVLYVRRGATWDHLFRSLGTLVANHNRTLIGRAQRRAAPEAEPATVDSGAGLNL